jgi:hypothetical protein
VTYIMAFQLALWTGAVSLGFFLVIEMEGHCPLECASTSHEFFPYDTLPSWSNHVSFVFSALLYLQPLRSACTLYIYNYFGSIEDMHLIVNRSVLLISKRSLAHVLLLTNFYTP